MLKRRNKNLYVVKTNTGKILYRKEDGGYCFYEGKTMKFYFLDTITGIFYLNYLGVISVKKVRSTLKKVLGYEVDVLIFDDIKKKYLGSLPPTLLSV